MIMILFSVTVAERRTFAQNLKTGSPNLILTASGNESIVLQNSLCIASICMH